MGENDSLDEIRNNKLDSAFKEVMSLADILSNTLEPLVTELKGMEPEEIRKCLPLEKDGDRIVKLEQEIHTPDGNAIRLDVLFELKTPGNKPIRIEVNLEGQSKRRQSYPLLNRAVYYNASLIHDQKGKYFQGDHYEKMNKVYSIWFILSPRRNEMNTIIRHHMVPENITGSASSECHRCDMMEIIEVNIGETVDQNNKLLGILNTLFSKTLDADERIKILNENYKIGLSEYLVRGVRDLSMVTYDPTMDEEILMDYIDDRIDEMIDAGKLFTSEQMQQQVQQMQQQMQQHRDEIIDVIVGMIVKLVDGGWSYERAIEESVPDEYRAEVRDRISERFS